MAMSTVIQFSVGVGSVAIKAASRRRTVNNCAVRRQYPSVQVSINGVYN